MGVSNGAKQTIFNKKLTHTEKALWLDDTAMPFCIASEIIRNNV